MESAITKKDEMQRARMETIFREHYSAVHTHIFNRVRRHDVADDLTSIVFLKAFRWLLEDRGLRQVRSWLYATARTTIADYWHEQLTHASLPFEALEESAIVSPERLENRQASERVCHLLSLLSEREREVLLLRYDQGYSAAEVGSELGLSPGHVRVLQLRALRRMALFEEERKYVQMEDERLTYTEQGQRVLDLAREEALALRHYYIGTEHLLLGILAEGSAAKPLIEQGTTLEHVRAGLIFLLGREQGEPATEIPLTPQARHALDQASLQAQKRAIGPQDILYALQGAEGEYGITYGILQSLGVERRPAQTQSIDEETNESALALQEYLVKLYPEISDEEERRLAHLVNTGERARKRAEHLNEPPDDQTIEEGKTAYFRLFIANQQLVLAIAQEYFMSGKDLARLLEAGNKGLTYAIHKFGMKRQVAFRTYATHWIHLEIIESVLE